MPALSGQFATCAEAAGAGHLDVLKWAREYCPWDRWNACCLRAAEEGGHLEVLRWAREHGCPWDEETAAWAAKKGHLEMLRWVREHDCPWGADTCAFAAQGGHLEVCSGRGSRTARGASGHVYSPLGGVDIWRCCSGRGSTTVRGAS